MRLEPQQVFEQSLCRSNLPTGYRPGLDLREGVDVVEALKAQAKRTPREQLRKCCAASHPFLDVVVNVGEHHFQGTFMQRHLSKVIWQVFVCCLVGAKCQVPAVSKQQASALEARKLSTPRPCNVIKLIHTLGRNKTMDASSHITIADKVGANMKTSCWMSIRKLFGLSSYL